MNDLEWLKIFGINGTVFATVSLSDIELILKLVLLLLTCVWTAVKIVKLLKEE
tara:strand:+ start:5335 stop:5493 length:159 start_codon:yes stop_codon:yes gene_type:complete